MNEQLLAGGETPGLASLHELRLTVLLRDVVKQKGRMEAAKVLRVNYKALAAALQSGNLTPRLCDALERLLMIRELAALEEVNESVRGLSQQVKEVVDRVNKLGRVAANLKGGVGEMRQEVDDEFSSSDEEAGPGVQ